MTTCPHPKPRRMLFFPDVKCREPNCINFRAYNPDDLIFSAFQICACGAGLAYPKDVQPATGSWDCSDILMQRAVPGGKVGTKSHCTPYPFMSFKVRSELNPFYPGQTTRPKP